MQGIRKFNLIHFILSFDQRIHYRSENHPKFLHAFFVTRMTHTAIVLQKHYIDMLFKKLHGEITMAFKFFEGVECFATWLAEAMFNTASILDFSCANFEEILFLFWGIQWQFKVIP